MDPRANFAYSTVATAPSPASSGTSLVVAAADGAKFPAAPFQATIWPTAVQPLTTNAEIVTVTAKSTDTLTITRAQESTSARTVVVGDQIAATLTAKTISDLEGHYLTVNDQVIAGGTQEIYEDYFELAASYVHELAVDSMLVIGDYATPLPAPDQNADIFISVADETVPTNREIVFSEFYEISAPFALEAAPDAVIQLGTMPTIGSSSPFLPGYEIGYSQITASVNVISTTEATSTTIISPNPIAFDGAPVIATFFAPSIQIGTGTNAFVVVSLFEGATQISRLVNASQTSSGNNLAMPGIGMLRFTPTVGYHTYTVSAFTVGTTGTPQIVAGAGGTAAYPPAFIRFTKV